MEMGKIVSCRGVHDHREDQDDWDQVSAAMTEKPRNFIIIEMV